MVFESIVAELLNKYVGDYVENLDKSQLKIGIWGGDVVLNNLELKNTALDDLDLPIKVVAGHIGKLTLKIPWKNLYTEPVVATIDSVYALAVPNSSLKYEAEKEEKAKQEKKQKKLRQVEEAKEAEKNKESPKEGKKDTFAEKLATQVVKNLQVVISRIHVRYEDDTKDHDHPFAVGITLQQLAFQTTDQNWKPCIVKEAVTEIFKLVNLQSLALYWNSNTESFRKYIDNGEFNKAMEKTIFTLSHQVPFQYLIKPVSSKLQLRLNTKPEKSNFSIPKVLTNLVMEEIAVELRKSQYDDILEMLESFERMVLADKYRKFEPPDRKSNKRFKLWWQFAYTCILEKTVRRRRNMWSWERIKFHREICKKYKEAYFKKLSHKKIGNDVQSILEVCENQLDVFNIAVTRQQAEIQVKIQGAKKEKEKEEQSKKGWFGRFMGGSSSKKSKQKGIDEQFEEAMTTEEKQKLYDAIGYQESISDPSLPKQYVAHKFHFMLKNLLFTLKDDKKCKEQQIVKFQLQNFSAAIGQRPSADAVSVDAKMDSLAVLGLSHNGVTPQLVASQNIEANQRYALINFGLETNPLNSDASTAVKLSSMPVQIIYDAVTVNHVVEFLQPPETVFLKQLTENAMKKLDELKQKSAAGLQFALEQRKFTDLQVDLKPSYLIVPETGFYTKNQRILLVDFGNLKIRTEKVDLKTSSLVGKTSLEQLSEKSYDKFNINLDSFQVLYADKGENWQEARQKSDTSQHVLKPYAINIQVKKCMVDDSRLPKLKINGELPLLSLSLSDRRIVQLIELGVSIPLPDVSSPAKDRSVIGVDLVTDESEVLTDLASITDGGPERKKKPVHQESFQEQVNETDIELNFLLKEFNVNVSHHIGNKVVPLMKVMVRSLGAEVLVKTFDMSVDAHLGGIYLQHNQFKGPPVKSTTYESVARIHDDVLHQGPLVNIINTPVSDDTKEKLLSFSYLKADKEGPEFSTTYGNIEQKVTVNFSTLEVLFHQEALLSIIEFIQALKLDELLDGDKIEKKSSDTVEKSSETTKDDKAKPRKSTDCVVDILIEAELDSFKLGICTEERFLAEAKIKGLKAKVVVDKEKTSIGASLEDVVIFDPFEKSFYPKILSVDGEEVFRLDVKVFNNATEGDNYNDMSCVDTSVEFCSSCVKFVFLNRFVMDLLAFVDNFQAAKDKLAEAGAQAIESSKEIAQHLYNKAPRVVLGVSIKAPVVIVPQNSRSSNVIMADLGHIQLVNSFTKEITKNDVGMSAVMDNMNISLTDVQLTRAILNPKQEIVADCLLLEPVNIQLSVTRNLSPSWYHGKSEVDISGTLDLVKLNMSQGDFTLFMLVLNENLSDGQTSSNQHHQQQVAHRAVQGATPDGSSPKEMTDALKPNPAAKTHKRVCFNVELACLSAALYTGESNMKHTKTKRDESKSLGKFELQTIKAQGTVMSDNTLKASMMLQNCILDDTREHKADHPRIVTRLIQRHVGISSESTANKKNMIDVTVTQDNNQNSEIVCKVCSIDVCLFPEYLASLADFFIKGLPETTPSTKKTTSMIQEKKAHTTAMPEQNKVISGGMRLLLTVEKPEIILIEDVTDSNSNAFILQAGINFRLHRNEEFQQISGEVKDLEIVSCVYAKDKRSQTSKKILHPCDIALHGKAAPSGKGQHIDVMMSDLIVNISPLSIRVMSSIVSTLTMGSNGAQKDENGVNWENLWQQKSISEAKLPFLQHAEEVMEALTEDEKLTNEELKLTEELSSRGELLIFTVKSVTVNVEATVGKRSVPMIILEASANAEVKDWSSKLYVKGSLGVQVAYYNERLSVWEFLLEPVETMEQEANHRPYELTLEVTQNDDYVEADLDGDSVDTLRLLQPKMSISVTSMDMMQTTVTKTSIEVLASLSKAFTDAIKHVDLTLPKTATLAPYIVKNDIGIPITVKIDDNLKQENSDIGNVTLESGQILPLYDVPKKVSILSTGSVIKATQEGVKKTFVVSIPQFKTSKTVPVSRAEKRLFDVNQGKSNMWKVLCDVQASIGNKTIVLRSILQVKNHFDFPMEVQYSQSQMAIISPGEEFNVPVHNVYQQDCSRMFFKPPGDEYFLCTTPVVWKTTQDAQVNIVECQAANANRPSFYINVIPNVEDVLNEQKRMMKCFTLHLKPHVMFRNSLPCDVVMLIEGSEELTMPRGVSVSLYSACLDKTTTEIMIKNYQGTDWSLRLQFSDKMKEMSVHEFVAHKDGRKQVMNLGLVVQQVSDSVEINLFAPYWMINKTGLPLTYKGFDGDTEVEHPPDIGDVILFSFKPKFLSTKKKASLKVLDSDWSEKFSLDTVGSSGKVTCKCNRQSFEVGVNIKLGYSGLTKIVTLTPYYLLVNRSQVATLCCSEVLNEAEWISVPYGKCIPMWPQQTKEITLKAKVEDTNEETGSFVLNKHHTSLLKLNSKYGGISTDVQILESSVLLTLNTYESGMADVLVINHLVISNTEIVFSQRDSPNKTVVVKSGHTQLYSWENPQGKRELIWSCGKQKDKRADLKDQFDDFFLDNDDFKAYCISFLYGDQRMLLFTEDISLAFGVYQAVELERLDQEITVSLHGIGLSLVDNYNMTELSYMAVTSSGIIWEEKKKIFKALNLKDCQKLEAGWQMHQNELATGQMSNPLQKLDGKMEVDFTTNADGLMMMFKPNKRPIRRSFQSGIWLQYKTSFHQEQIHAKIQKIQLDNQNPSNVFPTVLYAIPPPKSVAAESVPKPFIEMSAILRKHEHTTVKQVKYFKVLLQEMAIKIDQSFIDGMVKMFTLDGGLTNEQKVSGFADDIVLIHRCLEDIFAISLSQGSRNYYDIFHFSPIKIHVSFSLHGGNGDYATSFPMNIINTFLQSVGVVLTDVQDVVFRLGYFERGSCFYNHRQLQSEIIRHYSSQAIKQMYVLVLGLDVLGNPFGLIAGVAEGITSLFYEPYQGAVQGPEEFAEGLTLGVRSLLGHAVGGAAGAVSRITGTIGKGLAVLTMDDDYQKKRRENRSKRPADLSEGLARGGKGLVMGVFDGVTGIVRKPVEGAKQEGVEGFFKGLGKGLIGVVTRPTSGVIDFASSSFEGIKRVAEMSDEVHLLRPHRFLHSDGIVRPYIHQQAVGNSILKELEKGKYTLTDTYVAHMVIRKEGKHVLIATSRRVMVVIKGDILGQWTIDLEIPWTDFKEPPSVSSRGIVMTLKEKQQKSGFSNLFSSKKSERVIMYQDRKLAEWVVGKMREAINKYH